MAFPQSFIEDLRLQADIVQVVQDYVSLKRAGATYKGLCPFHAEKTPSFHVNREKGFFHCFGCGVGGDVFKFLELQEKMGFQDAVRHLAQRFGLPLPELERAADGQPDAAEREALLKVHERAAAYFRSQLASNAGSRARKALRDRGLTAETIDRLGLGFAPSSAQGLKTALAGEGFSVPLLLKAGLLAQREGGQPVDRFRGRLMIPIARDSGSVVAFGGRAMEPDQQPKYLNSPETPIYVKGRTLYGLHLTKSEVRRLGYAVLVEGYFDFAQLLQAGVTPVVASCGTALTPQQAHLLRRFTARTILSFDPDAAGQGAAARSCEMLVSEGFDVNVAVLPPGDDPDAFVRRQGRDAYLALLRTSRQWLEFLLDRAAADHDLGTDEGRRGFLNQMLAVAARIPDAAARDQFGDRLAHKARITEDVVRAEVRKAAVARRPSLPEGHVPSLSQMKQAEKGLIWAVVHEPDGASAALKQLEPQDLEGLQSRSVLEAARRFFGEDAQPMPPSAFLERLNSMEAQLVTGIAAEAGSPAPAAECVMEIRRLRFEREHSSLRAEFEKLQAGDSPGDVAAVAALWRRKKDLYTKSRH